MKRMIYLLIGCLFLFCCRQKIVTDNPMMKNVEIVKYKSTPVFNQDSAYVFVERQVQFGPRVPNTEAHKACSQFLVSELERFVDKIYVQNAVLIAYNGVHLQATNIIGVFNPEQAKRVMIFAHWDTRPYAEHDEDPSKHNIPIDGADDGASGVGVLLEMARIFRMNDPEIGIDIIFFDAEDYGPPSTLGSVPPGDWFALGSQFWAKNPHISNYKAEYGILLDMVGSKNATFYKEAISIHYAEPFVENVWNTSRNLGYGKFFINEKGIAVTDDHEYIIKGRGIPCIDIINTSSLTNHHFASHWHTQQDKMDVIDPETLKAVGQTLLEVIYKN